MEKKDKLYQELQEDLSRYKNVLNEAANTIIDQEVSTFPIMVLHRQDELGIGIPVIDRRNVSGNWSVNASTLEEFVTRQLIAEEKIESFKSLFEAHHNEFCLFVIGEIGANFVFSPRE